MIVRNEEQHIETCLRSVLEHVHVDCWCIVDTGSEDSTREIVLDTLKDVPGLLHERPWVNFAHNRTELLELAGRYLGHVLIMDADMTCGGSLPDVHADCADVWIRMNGGAHKHALPYVVRAGMPWRYVGAVHEYLTCDVSFTKERVHDEDFWLDHAPSERSRGASTETLQRDLALLTEDVALTGNPRSTFYLAQTLRDLGRLREAADVYQRRASMGGFPEEVWYARYMVGVCYLRLGDERAAVVLLDAYNLRPWRAEPLVRLARERESVQRFSVAEMLLETAARIPYPESDVLFIEPEAYTLSVTSPA